MTELNFMSIFRARVRSPLSHYQQLYLISLRLHKAESQKMKQQQNIIQVATHISNFELLSGETAGSTGGRLRSVFRRT
jgi:endonuclease/exonuclease/phosphatase (EEP) superfamily protein YafD